MSLVTPSAHEPIEFHRDIVMSMTRRTDRRLGRVGIRHLMNLLRSGARPTPTTALLEFPAHDLPSRQITACCSNEVGPHVGDDHVVLTLSFGAGTLPTPNQ
jgi:hypothetical protein